jgi:hypothetical protein
MCESPVNRRHKQRNPLASFQRLSSCRESESYATNVDRLRLFPLINLELPGTPPWRYPTGVGDTDIKSSTLRENLLYRTVQIVQSRDIATHEVWRIFHGLAWQIGTIDT